MMKQILIFLAMGSFLLVNGSCNLHFRENTERMNALNEMQQTDADFSNRSKEVGMKKAMLEYMEAEAILLRPNSLPLVGADALTAITSLSDSSFVLTWQPRGGDVSAAADMGYTYGVYNLTRGDSTGHGTYVTVWKKQDDGRWKFVLDSGNEGTGNEMNDEPRVEQN